MTKLGAFSRTGVPILRGDTVRRLPDKWPHKGGRLPQDPAPDFTYYVEAVEGSVGYVKLVEMKGHWHAHDFEVVRRRSFLANLILRAQRMMMKPILHWVTLLLMFLTMGIAFGWGIRLLVEVLTR